MIIILFGGGLGNQMFQYALGRHLSIKNNQPLKLDNSRYIAKPDTQKFERPFSLKHFNIAGEIASKEKINNLTKLNKFNILYRILLKLGIKNFEKKYYKKLFIREPIDRYAIFDNNILNHNYINGYFRGFWQSYKYFEEIKDILIKDFTLRGPQNQKYNDMLININNSNSISILIRRGDYVLPELNKIFYECTPDYFLQAVEVIVEKIGIPKLFIISDGMNWVKKNIKFPYPTEYISHDEFTDCQKIMFMSACKHNVTSNSSFAWWGAWLNQNPNKIIIAPKQWLADKTKNEKYIKDLIPESWIKI